MRAIFLIFVATPRFPVLFTLGFAAASVAMGAKAHFINVSYLFF